MRIDFEKAEKISRMRLSSNREYYYDTDYLDKKPYLPRYEYDMDVLKEDGTWQPWVGTWFVNKKLNEKHPERKAGPRRNSAPDRLAGRGRTATQFCWPLCPPGGHSRPASRQSRESPGRSRAWRPVPQSLGGDLHLTSKASGSKRRAEFAEWISSVENPLTARVMVNRIWHHVFGSGIVPTTSDFGSAGVPPTHPQLLDWLAAEFMQPSVDSRSAKPWSMKSLIRLLVMSDAFRQSSTPTLNGHGKGREFRTFCGDTHRNVWRRK